MTNVVPGIFDGLEPKCKARLEDLTRRDPYMRPEYLDQIVRDAMLDSQAISLKRIADFCDWFMSSKMRNEI